MGVLKKLALLMAVMICIQLVFLSSVQSAMADPLLVKELNFVYLHGVGGNVCSFQLLNDVIKEQVKDYIIDYEQANPGTKVLVNTLRRCYPSNVDINSWANNIADSISKHFYDKDNLILIGSSMGGKAALYAVAQNIGGLADKVALVVTINSPIKSLQDYFVTGGGPISDYWQLAWFFSDEGILHSATYYDSSQDGRWVGQNRHWLAFTSAESTPLSEQFDVAGIDVWPRDMDDNLVPISAQYSEGADVIYYGEHSHVDFTVSNDVAEFLVDYILRYIFGGNIECSVLARIGILGHKADWLLGPDYWEDVVGEALVDTGSFKHKNESYTKWQEWEDVVGQCTFKDKRGSYRVNRVGFLPFIASIEEARWLNPDDLENCQLYLRTRAAPRMSVEVEWRIYQQGSLSPGFVRDHYEVDIVEGTPFTGIEQVFWETDGPRDLRLRIRSKAQSPFRWFWAQWRVYYKEVRQRQLINEIPVRILENKSN
ncbi:MAG TPA: hypothetical protein G4O06_01700 [Dehalococcoidia bacterium]|nr:hypothetical protein [Dehalococcoidia bacterium]